METRKLINMDLVVICLEWVVKMDKKETFLELSLGCHVLSRLAQGPLGILKVDVEVLILAL